jgi:hypothetical protein
MAYSSFLNEMGGSRYHHSAHQAQGFGKFGNHYQLLGNTNYLANAILIVKINTYFVKNISAFSNIRKNNPCCKAFF